MEGVDPDWVYTDASRRFVTYTQLAPGEYIFRVKGSNNDGFWNEAGTSLKITILPPWWRTYTAYASYLLLLGIMFFAIWRSQRKRQILKQQAQMEHFEAEKLREVDHMKSQFFTNISHEFRTPLTLIKGPLKQLLSGEFTGNIKEQYEMMLRNSDRLLNHINEILDLSSLEAGQTKLRVAKTDILKFIRGLMLSFSSLAESKNVTLKFNTIEKSLYGYIDHDKLYKIITNLLSNAFKFTPEGGEIILDCGLRNAELTENKYSEFKIPDSKILLITISNTGPGIPPEQLDKIFDRFHQADDNYKKDGEGTGIGLALTKELVELCHGEISVSSIPDKKTNFIVILPIAIEHFKEDERVDTPQTSSVAQAEQIKIPTDVSLSSIEDSRKKTSPSSRPVRMKSSKIPQAPSILIVEDNPDVTSYISSFMEKEYRILTAENGKEGIKKTIDKYPDLIISDVMMPEIDGFELCQMIKTDERISHIPIILLTAKADLESKIDGLEFGADDYVTKPFEARELQIRSKNLIEQRKKLREKFSVLIDLNPAEIAASSMDEQLLQRLLAVFEEHIEEPEFSIEQLAHEIGMSRRHLNRKIQAITNLSPTDFIRTLRLQRAAGMLRNASGTVSEIAYKVGFNNLSYFSKAFRKQFGRLPSEFPKK
jgi:signal transduction histidine kinase/DNA-binding response OmpR family regulator